MSQVVTTQSWGTRIKNAFVGILFGFILIGVSLYFVFWNEGSSLHTAQSLQQTEEVLISVPASPIDPANNNKVIHFYGQATTTQTLSDNFLNISKQAIRLNRKVEMYQWQEHVETSTQDNVGGSQTETKTYTYDKTWSGSINKSADFHDQAGHENPDHMPIKSSVHQATAVTVGDFELPQDLINQISGVTALDLTNVDVKALQARFNKPTVLDGNEIYVGVNPQQPEIGDLRISATEVLPQIVSIIAQQTGKTVQPYRAPAGKAIALLSMGQQTPADMIDEAEAENQMMTWIIRAATLLGMIFGFLLIMQPLVVLASVLPFLGSIVGMGTGLIGFLLGLSLWIIATAIAWFAVRPLMAVILLIAGAVICYSIYMWRRNSQQRV